MERTATALMTALWISIVAGIGIAYWIWATPSVITNEITGAERAMGEAMMMFAGGILGGLLIGGAAFTLLYRIAPAASLGTTQALSAIALLILVTLAAIWMRQTKPEEFVSYTGVLEIEVRVPKPLYKSAKLQGTMVVGTSSFLPPDLGRYGHTREEGGYMVQNSTMVIPAIHEWNVTVTASEIDQVWFRLPWPDQPPAALPWTDWMVPTEKKGTRSDGIEVRCQWKLAPTSRELYVRRFF